VRWPLRLFVSGSILAYIVFDVDWNDLVRAVAGVRLSLLAVAATIYLLGQVLSALKWSLIGRALGFDRPFRDYLRFYFIGMFFNLFGPSTLGGDLVRSLYLSDGRRRGVALNSTLFDRASGLVVLMALGAVAALVFPRHDFPTALLVGVVATGFGFVIGWWLCPRAVRVLPEQNGVRRLVEHDLAPLWRDHRMLARVIGVSLTFHLSQVGVQLVLARAAGIALPWSYLLVVHPLLSVMMALPLSIGGFGVREGGYLYFLTRIDVDDSVALAMSLSWWAVTVVSALLGGLVFTLTGARLPRLRPQESPSVLLAAPGVATSDLPPV
jgi:uncharacterized membrane protein YbhN (UPF0104 family)